MFDFDGVLVNTIDMSFGVSQRMDAQMTHERYLLNHEGNVFKMFNATRDAISNFFTEYQQGLRRHEMSADLIELVKTLAERHQLMIISSTPSPIISSYLEGINMRHYFGAILGGDIDPDKSKKIRMACAQTACTPQDTLFITDTLGDIKEANRVNAPTIGVAWGLHPPETLQRGNLAALVNTPAELLVAIRELS